MTTARLGGRQPPSRITGWRPVQQARPRAQRSAQEPEQPGASRPGPQAQESQGRQPGRPVQAPQPVESQVRQPGGQPAEPQTAPPVRLARAPQGRPVLTGPAGSGKSTTLAAILRYVQACFPGKSIVTLEDPVERQIDGVTQVQISPHGQMTFPVALRSLLRQDPQVLMIGEIRDAQTAAIAAEAALTGHLLASTMHSGSPGGALLRLLEMGIEPYQVTSSVIGVLNQRLVRRLCRHCGSAQGGRARAGGCEHCFGSGYSGRALVAELVELDGELRKALLAKADLEELESILQRRGHMHLRADARRLVSQGLTTEEEASTACGGID